MIYYKYLVLEEIMEQYRMDLHQIPELGFKEFKTQEYILNHLKGYDCKIEIINTIITSPIIRIFMKKNSACK